MCGQSGCTTWPEALPRMTLQLRYSKLGRSVGSRQFHHHSPTSRRDNSGKGINTILVSVKSCSRRCRPRDMGLMNQHLDDAMHKQHWIHDDVYYTQYVFAHVIPGLYGIFMPTCYTGLPLHYFIITHLAPWPAPVAHYLCASQRPVLPSTFPTNPKSHFPSFSPFGPGG